MNQIRQSNIKIYEFPQEKEINAKLPFAVVGSNCVLDINGEKIRGRRYPWGVVNVSIKLGSTSLLRIIVIEDLGTLIVYLIKGICSSGHEWRFFYLADALMKHFSEGMLH